MLDEDVDNVFLNTLEYAAAATRVDLDGNSTPVTINFEFQVGAVDEKERAIFRVKDDVAWERGDYVVFLTNRWTVIDIRPDELGMLELRCDIPETTS